MRAFKWIQFYYYYYYSYADMPEGAPVLLLLKHRKTVPLKGRIKNPCRLFKETQVCESD